MIGIWGNGECVTGKTARAINVCRRFFQKDHSAESMMRCDRLYPKSRDLMGYLQNEGIPTSSSMIALNPAECVKRDVESDKNNTAM